MLSTPLTVGVPRLEVLTGLAAVAAAVAALLLQAPPAARQRRLRGSTARTAATGRRPCGRWRGQDGLRLARRAPGPGAADVEALAASLAAQLRAGAAPAAAWSAVASSGTLPAWAGTVVSHVGVGLPVSAALERAVGAARPDERRACSALRAAWETAEATGAPLADVLDVLAGAARGDDELDALRRAGLAGPRATARVLAVLPGLGLLLGQALGAQPLAALTATPAGRLCAGIGAVLVVAGWWSTRVLLARAARP